VLFLSASLAAQTAKGADAQAKELVRLEGMKDKKMLAEQKAFLFARINILKSLAAPKEEL
jgi:hypothetical protein